MKHVTLFTLLLLTFSCAKQGVPLSSEADPSSASNAPILDVSMYLSEKIDPKTAMDHPYDLSYTMERAADGRYTLVADLKLHGGSFFVSPLSSGDFKGKFRVDLSEQHNLELGGVPSEMPRSQEVIDQHPFVDGPVNWVTDDTRYTYPMTILSDEDFDVGGKLIFVIEPRCTMEEVPLIFKYRSGVLTVEKWEC